MSVKKQKEKKMWIGLAIILALVLIVSYFISQKNKKGDLAHIQKVEVANLQVHLKGNKDAELKLIEYSDFQCPACQYWYGELKKLEAQYENDFQVEYHHLPLRSIHPNAQIAAQAAEAAGRQGKFWEMHDMLFERQAEWSQSFKPEQLFKQYADSLGLDTRRFAYDMNSDEVKDFVNKQYDDALASGLKLQTPTFTLNGEVIQLEDFANNYLKKKKVSLETKKENN